jgi:hypothetical protein
MWPTLASVYAVAFLMLPGPVLGANIFWGGTGGNDLWGNVGNWNGSAIPDSDDVATFDDFMDPSLTPMVDLNGDRTVQSITIVSARPYTLNNNTLSLGIGDINVNEDGPTPHTINSNIQINDNGLWTVETDATLVVNGVVSEDGLFHSLPPPPSPTVITAAYCSESACTIYTLAE